MKYNFDEIVNRRNTNSVKWDFGDELKALGLTERFDEDTLPLFTADMDFAVPPCIVEALHKVVDNQIYGYTMAGSEYYSAIQNWFKTRHDWDIKKEEILFCPGTVFALSIAVRAFTDEGDGVIIQRPVYFPFTDTIERLGRVVANNQMIRNDDYTYSLDLKGFEELAKKPENKLFILCNPHNPSGRIFDNEELKEMARIAKENNVIVVSDEIHGDLIRRGAKFTPLVKVADDDSNIITCTAINKTFNVAGLHATNVVISNSEVRAKYFQVLGMTLPTPFTVAAVTSAYNEGAEWLEELKDYLDGTFDWVLNFIKENLPKVKCVKPEGSYVLWMDFRDYGISAEEIRKKIYVNANVILEGGHLFDPDQGQGFERICLSSPRPLIKEAFERIAKEFEGL